MRFFPFWEKAYRFIWPTSLVVLGNKILPFNISYEIHHPNFGAKLWWFCVFSHILIIPSTTTWSTHATPPGVDWGRAARLHYVGTGIPSSIPNVAWMIEHPGNTQGLTKKKAHGKKGGFEMGEALSSLRIMGSQVPGVNCRSQNPAIQVQVPLYEGPMILRVEAKISVKHICNGCNGNLDGVFRWDFFGVFGTPNFESGYPHRIIEFFFSEAYMNLINFTRIYRSKACEWSS